jgi:predicted nucleic acid-binding protein
MIFLDSSAIFALADRRDIYHAAALRMFNKAENDGEELLTHSYAIVESAALLERRLGLQVALEFLKEVTKFIIIWVDEDLHNASVSLLAKSKITHLSLVDAVSFQVMQQNGIKRYMGFDQHFKEGKFQPYLT